MLALVSPVKQIMRDARQYRAPNEGYKAPDRDGVYMAGHENQAHSIRGSGDVERYPYHSIHECRNSFLSE